LPLCTVIEHANRFLFDKRTVSLWTNCAPSIG
jgi:hypothetical protein